MDSIEHYNLQAEKFGDSKQSTMMDIITRDKEVEKIISTIKSFKLYQPRILEIGCGNGYTAEQVLKNIETKSYVGLDINEELLNIVVSRNLCGYFGKGNCLDIQYHDRSFDIVFSERCLINLITWENQQRAINEIYRVLEKGGYYIMVEAFTDAHDNINAAREAIGLERIPVPFHNLFFNKDILMPFMNQLFMSIPAENNFLSTYYYGSRVLYPAFCYSFGEDLVYNNKFIEFFSYMQPLGNYGYIQIHVWRKK